MLAMFILAVRALCRALADLLPGMGGHCRPWRTAMIAAVPGRSQDPIPGLSLELRSGGAAGRRRRGKHPPAPAWFEPG